jgi:DNA sulfur modification protein DndD
LVQAEYHRFLQTLNSHTVSGPVKKIANLVKAHLNELIPLGTNQGQRIKRLVTIAQSNWEVLSSEIQPTAENPIERSDVFSQIKRLEVGPFRGFAKQENFDLNNRLVLIYGPNGTGKSSFCEALEYSLLGNVVEADSKRFHDQTEYLKNAYVDQFAPPRIYANDEYGQEHQIRSDEALYRFCFVEKNRIDNFSRIAAQVPAKQTELISTLFGLESFTEFVQNFTAEMDERYIDILGQKAHQLRQRQQTVSGAPQQLLSCDNDLNAINAEEATLANKYRANCSFEQMVLEINGNGDSPGKLAKLDKELQTPIAPKRNVSLNALNTFGSNISTTFEAYQQKLQLLGEASQQVSFKKMYEAISELHLSNPDACPACKTPLINVAVNPYSNATQALRDLQQLAVIQNESLQLEQSINQQLFQLYQVVVTCLRFNPQSNSLSKFELPSNFNFQPNISWWNAISHNSSDNFSPWQQLVAQVHQIESLDLLIDELARQRNTKQSELHTLREYARQITVLQTRRQTVNIAKSSAQQVITSFQTDNAKLIEEVESEKAIVLKNQEISIAYASFVSKLSAYKDNLPSQLVANLGDSVVELYNSFNRNDLPLDLLAKVALPLAQNQRLKITFQSEPTKYHDALHILSEGHIRCLGLAILLAKNLSESAPVLIFDDPVNAIDEDHRESIRRTLFEDQYFSNKQILLTCHGEEFFKDIQNLLPAQLAGQAKLFSFLPRTGERHILIDYHCAPRNYIIAARDHLGRNEIRFALAKSRQALESLTKGKVWRYVSRYGDGNLSLKFRSSSSPIELRNITDQLKSKIGKADFLDANKNVIYAPLDGLLGLNGESREWRYLNKGTHEEEDRAEFDRSAVQTIVSLLEQLDNALGN